MEKENQSLAVHIPSNQAEGLVHLDLQTLLETQKESILSAVNSTIQDLKGNLQAQADLFSQIATGNEQQFYFNKKIKSAINLP